MPLLFALLLPIGCADRRVDLSTKPVGVEAAKAAEADAMADLIRSDPRGYIQRVAEKAAELEDYTLLFTRIERRGLLFKSLKGPEQIRCWFRREPFSIRMKWIDDEVKYGESVYVAGQENNQVRFIPRHGLFGLPPTLTKVDLQTPVTWGEARRPMDQWGLENLMLQTLKSHEEVEPRGGAIIEYRGIVTLPDREDQPVHYMHTYYPRDPGQPTIQELYFDVATNLPVGTIIRYTEGGKIDAAYFYDDLSTKLNLTDADFILDAERDAKTADGKQPAGESNVARPPSAGSSADRDGPRPPPAGSAPGDRTADRRRSSAAAGDPRLSSDPDKP